MVDPTDPSAPNSQLLNVWNATGLVRPHEAKLCERMDSGQLANATRYFAYLLDSAPGCPTSGSRPAVSYSIRVESEAIANPRTYTLVLLWTPDVNCPRCECGDCTCAREVSDPVVVNGEQVCCHSLQLHSSSIVNIKRYALIPFYIRYLLSRSHGNWRHNLTPNH